MAVMLEAGLEGIKQNLAIPPPRQKNLYRTDEQKLNDLHVERLPSSLWEATNNIRSSNLIKNTFENPLYESYILAKSREWDEYRLQVTSWEKNKYLLRY